MKGIEIAGKLSRMIFRGQKAIGAAKVSLKKGFIEDAASRAYYAVFHGMQAALESIGQTYSKHSGVISAFHREFISKGTFPKEFSKKIKTLEKHRQKGDYSYIWVLTELEVIQDITDAEIILKAIANYLKQKYSKDFWRENKK